MKKRNSKKSMIDWINEFDSELSEMVFEDHGMMTPESLDSILSAKFYPLFHRRSLKVKRKNGQIETHILFSDGSVDLTGVPLTKIKKGDVCLGEE